ncbi:hypothetical protein BDR03DRAFT_669569 [Suillus americanus]|nr:hypothetical protein BDR03DRAFT_669569 [Suillus americanus]
MSLQVVSTVPNNVLCHPRMTRTICGSTRTRGNLTRTGAGGPSKFYLPADWVRVPPGCIHVTLGCSKWPGSL